MPASTLTRNLACGAVRAAVILSLMVVVAPTAASNAGEPATKAVPSPVPPSVPTPQEEGTAGVLGSAGAAASYVYNGAAGWLWSATDGVAAVYSGVGQALYETAYMMGINRTPLPRTEFADSGADLWPLGTPIVPGVNIALSGPVPSPVPGPAAIAEAVPPPEAPAAAQPQQMDDPPSPALEPAVLQAPPLQPIDPGLLANLLYDRSSRNADGSFFVPKPLQRMFEVRTERVTTAEVRAVNKLNGRIVPDPKAHGRVEAGLLGRFEPPEAGMPVLGDVVRKGQILGSVVPVVGVVDGSNVRREIARLTHEIRVTAEGLEITKQFSFVPFRDGKIVQMEARLAGLRQERAALLPMLKTQEYLRAPIDGVIASSTAVAGRVTQPGEMVFDIVNPKLLWVEATVPDPMIAVEATPGTSASARTPEGQNLTLTYVGSGPAVRQQSTPMLFRIENPPKGLRVGRPASVLLQSEHTSQRGLPVRRAAISVGSDGVQQVWEQTDAETFVLHAIQTQDIDAQTVLVLNGLNEGARIVVRGVSLMAQLQ